MFTPNITYNFRTFLNIQTTQSSLKKILGDRNMGDQAAFLSLPALAQGLIMSMFYPSIKF